jgi:hypothetical protein
MKLRARFVIPLLCAAAAAAAGAQDAGEKSYLALEATTQTMALPGGLKLPAGVDLSKLPAEARAAFARFTEPQRHLQVRLWSPGAAPSNAKAELAIPPGLQLGPSLPLEINVPKERAEKFDQGRRGIPEMPEWEMRQYWKCSQTVLPGQPRVMKSSGLSAADRERYSRLRAGMLTLEKPDWTEAVWPNSIDKKSIAARPGSLQGEHTLKTTYLGNTSFRVTAPVDFLEPVVFQSPESGQKPDLKQHIPISWKPIPNALGYVAMAIAMKGRTTSIIWTSANDPDAGVHMDFPDMAQVRQMVEKGQALAPNVTSCNVPAGIFEGCDAVSITVTAYGPGQAFETPGQPAVRVQTRALGMVTLMNR